MFAADKNTTAYEVDQSEPRSVHNTCSAPTMKPQNIGSVADAYLPDGTTDGNQYEGWIY
jgi:hypothetical protein